MRIDTLTMAIVVFVIGLLLSSFSLSDVFGGEPEAPAPHQQGFTAHNA
ncbi:MAG TPA: hypothetical protein VIC26_15785 [Marinagarivorans sp.]